MDQEAYRLYSLLKSLTECCHDREEKLAREYDLSIPESRCLAAIEMEGCRTTTEIAEKLDLAKSRITRIADGMVAKGLITRKAAAHDRRVLYVEFTPRGKTLAQGFVKSLISLHEMVIGLFPQDRRKTVVDRLEEMKNAMQEVRDSMNNMDFGESASGKNTRSCA